MRKAFEVFALTNLAAVLLLAAGPVTAEQPDPYAQPDDTWISISGTVKNVGPNMFVLDYGDGTVTVEMDDGDRDADAYKLLEGDKVTVNGLIDDDFFEKTTIEASSVYVENINTYFYASAMDEEDAMVARSVWYTVPVVVGTSNLQGTVTAVNATGNEFTLDTGTRKVTVELENLTYDPLDDEGYQKIEKGDRVSVNGMIDYDLFEGRVFDATSLIKLSG